MVAKQITIFDTPRYFDSDVADSGRSNRSPSTSRKQELPAVVKTKISHRNKTKQNETKRKVALVSTNGGEVTRRKWTDVCGLARSCTTILKRVTC
ncbi:hypothetical protein F2P81_002561 [Scophthalmus maximus]|uniref:Uncharacterized protein n=1 Tax=Scophthalmus maximus TaxID=52904 RepID=A0A6A4TVH0_SCOMX|nr:hypothetical protein F2P81_002561 [Scophthalmus maximus]